MVLHTILNIKGGIMPRIIQVGTRKYTIVQSLDAPGIGGANHEYNILSAELVQDGELHNGKYQLSKGLFARISFQNGAIQEAGINGCHNEDLIAIVIDRLQSFQKSQFVCRENAIAITKLEEALLWLGKRTSDRQSRGVEGTHEV
jgi:hypothetical protein